MGQRTREIGLRMTLGATKGMILRMVIREGAALAAAGMVLGVLGAIAATRLVGTMRRHLRGLLYSGRSSGRHRSARGAPRR